MFRRDLCRRMGIFLLLQQDRGGPHLPPDNSVPSWADVLQGKCSYKWETQAVIEEEVARLQARFTDSIVSTEEEVEDAGKKWCCSLIGKFLGKGFSMEFLSKELKIGWVGAGEVKLIPLSAGH